MDSFDRMVEQCQLYAAFFLADLPTKVPTNLGNQV